MSGLTFWTPSRLQTAANLAGLGLTAAEIALARKLPVPGNPAKIALDKRHRAD